MNERVKLIRKQLGMTQEQLAQRLGIGKAALSMIETGKAGLSARNRNILVQELNVNPDWLETGKGNMFNAEPDLTAYMHRTDNSLPLQSVPLYSIEGDGGPGAAVHRPGAEQARQLHPHSQPPEMRRGDLYRRRLDVPAAQERRHRAVRAAARHRATSSGATCTCCRSTSTARST